MGRGRGPLRLSVLPPEGGEGLGGGVIAWSRLTEKQKHLGAGGWGKASMTKPT